MYKFTKFPAKQYFQTYTKLYLISTLYKWDIAGKGLKASKFDRPIKFDGEFTRASSFIAQRGYRRKS